MIGSVLKSRDIYSFLVGFGLAAVIFWTNAHVGGEPDGSIHVKDGDGTHKSVAETRPRPTVGMREKSGTTGASSGLAEVLANKANLTAGEFQLELLKACSQLQDANVPALEEALMLLPSGEDSLGGFNTLSFILFERDPAAAMAFFKERREDGSFPADWIQSAAESGIQELSRKEPVEAFRLASAAKGLAPTPTERARLISATLSGPYTDVSNEVVRELVSSAGDAGLIDALSNEQGVWSYLVKANSVDAMAEAMSRNKSTLSKYAKDALATSLSSSTDLDNGFSIIRDAFKNDPAIVSGFVKGWLKRDPNNALKGVGGLDAASRDLALSENIVEIANWDKASARQWADSIQDEKLRKNAQGKIK